MVCVHADLLSSQLPDVRTKSEGEEVAETMNGREFNSSSTEGHDRGRAPAIALLFFPVVLTCCILSIPLFLKLAPKLSARMAEMME